MELRHLRVFVTVAGTLNFRRAAEQLCMTQPPLSHAIKSLEEEIGVVLLDRKHKKNVQLTPAGENFLLAAHRILQDVDRATKTAQLTGEGDFGSLSIGYCDDYVYGTFPDLLNGFSLEHPNTALSVDQGVSYRLVNRLNRNEFDCIFTTQSLYKALSSYKTLPWSSTPIVALLPKGHSLAKQKSLDLSSLAHERFLMIGQANRTRFDDQISKLLVRAGFSPSVSLQVVSSILCMEMVRRGHGVALASTESIPAEQDGIAVLKIRDKGAFLERVIVWREENNNPSLRQFLEMAGAFTGKS